MASVTFKRGTKAEIESTQIQDGQLLMETDQLNNNKIYLDLPNGTRVPVGGSGAWVGTKGEFELAVKEGKIADGTQVIITDDYESGITASMTLYSNSQSGLVATNVQSAIDELNSNLKPIDSIPSSGYPLIDDGSFLDRDIQHIKCRISHPIVKTSAYLNIGTLPHQVKKTCYTTAILLYGSNVYPLIIKLQGNTISMFNSIAIQALDNGTQVESWIDCEYLIVD